MTEGFKSAREFIEQEKRRRERIDRMRDDTADWLRYVYGADFGKGKPHETAYTYRTDPVSGDRIYEEARKTADGETIHRLTPEMKGPRQTMIFGHHWSGKGPLFPADCPTLDMVVKRYSAATMLSKILGGNAPEAGPMLPDPADPEFARRRFRRVAYASQCFVEEGVCTYGEDGKIVECPCASCAAGWTKPGQELADYERAIEIALTGSR